MLPPIQTKTNGTYYDKYIRNRDLKNSAKWILTYLLAITPVLQHHVQCGNSTDSARQLTTEHTYTANTMRNASVRHHSILTLRRLDRAVNLLTDKDEDALNEMKLIRDSITTKLSNTTSMRSESSTVKLIASSIIDVVEGGYRERAYDDGFGTSTIGFGSVFIYKADGTQRRVRHTDRLSKEQAIEVKNRTIADITKFLDDFLQTHSVNVLLDSVSKAALVSFIYNIGRDGFLRSEVARHIINGNIQLAVRHMRSSHVTSNKRKANGLVRRRMIESAMLSAGGGRMLAKRTLP